ncbi:MAG TPA: BlaI/MecI/CopY family transcriptional regulator [Saprospiraceae bacterium]|nr:BlaI/MecI/CopY family transcriptional regulator [Saprospiraceae bacterium]
MFVPQQTFTTMRKLNQREEQIMQILWRLEQAFVKEIRAELEDPRPPTTTVSSVVRKLEAEGWVDHEAFGKTHRYFPVIKQEDYVKSSFKRMVNNYFDGSPSRLLSFFAKAEEVEADELQRLLKELEEDNESTP